MDAGSGREIIVTEDRHGGLNTILQVDYETTEIRILHMMEKPVRRVVLEPFRWPEDSSEELYDVRVTCDEHGGLNVILVIHTRTGRMKGMYMMEDGRAWRDMPAFG